MQNRKEPKPRPDPRAPLPVSGGGREAREHAGGPRRRGASRLGGAHCRRCLPVWAWPLLAQRNKEGEGTEVLRERLSDCRAHIGLAPVRSAGAMSGPHVKGAGGAQV